MSGMSSSPDSFTVEDIRRVREAFDKRHTDASGKYDWDAAAVETEAGAARMLVKIARIRSERPIVAK